MLELNNFNSLMAILAGINTSAVYRLKFTHEGLTKKSSAVSISFRYVLIFINLFQIDFN